MKLCDVAARHDERNNNALITTNDVPPFGSIAKNPLKDDPRSTKIFLKTGPMWVQKCIRFRT